MENNRIRAARDARPDADYIEQTIPADPDAVSVNALDVAALTTELDITFPPPEEDLIEQSTPAPLDDDR